MQKLLTHVAWFRFGVDSFTAQVNDYLNDGWKVVQLNIEKKGLRFVCHALLEKENAL